MQPNIQHDFVMERRLFALDPHLHRLFTNAVFAMQHILSNYKLIFPDFTDHTELHSLTVIDCCNRLIGNQIERLNADELYALLMGCYFHDTGMGISRKDYEAFSKQIDFGNYFDTHSRENLPAIIRDFHNEFSGLFIQKYKPFFEIPTDEHVRAIIQISRGHRKTDLMDQQEYPLALQIPDGQTLRLPYLSALIRLADEIDVGADRNPEILFDTSNLTNQRDIDIFGTHESIRQVDVTEDAIILRVALKEPRFESLIEELAEKIQKTLDNCRDVVEKHSDLRITQGKVIVEMIRL